MPFHFRDPRGQQLAEYLRRTAGLARYAPDVIRQFAAQDYGGIDVEDRLGEATHPVLVLAGRHDRVCPVAAAEEMARRLPDAELVVFENSAHMMFAEEQDRYLAAVRQFLDRINGQPAAAFPTLTRLPASPRDRLRDFAGPGDPATR
jgi:proline iminopeptidase